MKKLLSFVLAMTMILSLAACGGGGNQPSGGNEGGGDQPATDDKVYTCSLQFTFPEQVAAPIEEILHKMEEDSNGRLKFEVYYSFSMIAPGDVVDALQDGTLDVAGMMPNEHSMFSLNGRLCGMPLLGFESNEAATKTYLSLLYNNDAMMAEFTDNDLILWGAYMCPGYQMHFTEDITATDPSIFNGLTIMTDNVEMQKFIAEQGGAVAAAYPPDYYSNLSNGVAEGLVQHLNCVNAFGCIEQIKTSVNFGEGGFYNFPLVYCIGENFWNSLPEDLQAIFGEYADDLCRTAFEADMVLLSDNQPKLEAAAKIVDLTEDEMVVWKDAFQGILSETLDAISKENPAAKDTYAQLADMIANYDAETFKIGTNNFGHEFDW